jgi:magnesium-transporting ATPase (P-type)
MTLAILVFNFYPVTAVMIVMIALMNDGAILSIAYDNVQYRNKPEAWNMKLVLGISTVLGVIGVVAAFGLFLSRRARLSISTGARPDDDVPEIVRRRPSDDFPHPHARALLVHQTCEDSLDSRAWNTNTCDC